MSTYAELELRCKRRLGRRGFAITTEFLDEMKSAQETLEKMGTLPNWMRTVTGQATTPAGVHVVVDIPADDWIRQYDDQGLMYFDEDGTTEKRSIRLDTRDQLISKRNAGPSHPAAYYYISRISGDPIFEIVANLTKDTDFFNWYYAAEPVLTGNNTNKWCANEPNLIMGMAGVELAIWLRDDRALKYYQSLASSARRIMVHQTESDEWSDIDLVMGGPD